MRRFLFLQSTGSAAGALVLVLAVALCAPATAHDPDFTAVFDRDRCNFSTTGGNPFFPLWPGYALHLAGEEDDEGELVEIEAWITVLSETQLVDGVLTRVVEEREHEDGELIEVSRNFFVMCRETGDVWYFGEDVDDYEDGMIVGHGGAWRAGVDGAEPGIIMPGSPLVGARYFQETAPGVALDRAEVLSLDEEVTVPAGTFDDCLETVDTSGLDPDDESFKLFAPGVGTVVDDALELIEIVPPPCRPDDTTLCLSNGRFQVRADWETDSGEGDGTAILPSDDSGEFWFFSPNNTELLVKVIDACDSSFNSFWVFAAGLTNVGVTLTVTDTETAETKEYENPLGNPFSPVLDTSAFDTCP